MWRRVLVGMVAMAGCTDRKSAPLRREPSGPPFPSYVQLAAAGDALVDKVVAAVRGADSCAAIGAALDAVSPDIEDVAARIPVVWNVPVQGAEAMGADQDGRARSLLSNISCLDPIQAVCSGDRINRVLGSRAWVHVESTFEGWLLPGHSSPPCPAPLAVPRPASVTSAQALAQDRLLQAFEALTAAIAAAADCAGVVTALVNTAATMPDDAQDRIDAVLLARDSEVSDWANEVYGRRYRIARARTLDKQDQCRANPAFQAVVRGHPLGAMLTRD